MSENPEKDGEQEKTQWKKTSGYAEDTAVAQVICKEHDLDKWDREVEKHDYPSRSQYLYELIEEARAYRQEGFLSHHQSEQQIEELQSQVEQLEQQLEKKTQENSGKAEIDDVDFLEKFLDTQYKTLDELLREIVESGDLDDLIRKRVEDKLYFLASQNQVEYKTGWGWKLSENGGGQ